MRKTDKKKGAQAVKLSAILFLCVLICGASACRSSCHSDIDKKDKFGVGMISETVIAAESTFVPENTPKPETASIKPAEDYVAVPANPLIAHKDNGNMGEGEKISLPLSGLLIGIDPGHQARGNSEQEPIAPDSHETKAKVSSGTQGIMSGVPEYVVNLEVAFMLRDALVSYGAEVQMTRTTHNVDISNIQRALMFNESNADIVLRIHCNGSSNADAEGIGLYVTKTGAIADESAAMAGVILENMVGETGADKDGVFRRDTYTGLNWSEVPAMIVEMGFMSNPKEDILLQDPAYRQKLVTGMVKGIAEYYGRDLNME